MIKTRKLSDGSETFQVVWILGGGASGTAPRQSETFTVRERAEAFHADVRTCGWRWPDGWVKGRGYVRPEDEVDAAFSFAEVAADFFALQEKRVAKGLKKSYTDHREQQMCASHLLPSFGAKPLAHITPAMIEGWVDLQLQYGASPKSIRNRHGLLFTIMDHGRKRMGLRADNPCELTELPVDPNKRDLMWLNPWEWKILSACLREDARRMAEVLLQTGVRWGELSAIQLMNCQITPEGEVIVTINQAWSKRSPKDKEPIRPALQENRSWKLGLTKNGKSRRVRIVGDLAREIIELDMTGKEPWDFLFTTRSGKPWRYPDFEYDRWRQATHLAQQCGLPRHVTIHMLRHTYVVWMLARGESLHDISHIIGHSSYQITADTYGGFAGDDGRMSREMAQQIKIAENAIIPGQKMPSREEVYKPVRERRQKAG